MDGTCGQSTSGPSPTCQCFWRDRTEKAGKLDYRACTCRTQEREESSVLVAGIPLGTTNLSWKLLLEASALTLCPASFRVSNLKYSLCPSRSTGVILRLPSMCPCGTLAGKGPISFPCWLQSEEMQFASCFSDRDCRLKPTLIQRLHLEINKNLCDENVCTPGGSQDEETG